MQANKIPEHPANVLYKGINDDYYIYRSDEGDLLALGPDGHIGVCINAGYEVDDKPCGMKLKVELVKNVFCFREIKEMVGNFSSTNPAFKELLFTCDGKTVFEFGQNGSFKEVTASGHSFVKSNKKIVIQ